MTKIQISAEITKRETVSKEIELPFFCKTEDAYIKVISEKKALRLNNGLTTFIIVVNPQHYHNAVEIAEGVEITEEEFDNAAKAVLSEAHELAAVKTPSRYNDVNEEIDEILERRTS